LALQGVSDDPIATISGDNYMLSASQAARLHSGAVKVREMLRFMPVLHTQDLKDYLF
jgi:hypothetical protein